MRITLIQQQASHNREENLARGIEALKEAARRGSHLVVFPELSFQRFFPQSRKDQQSQPWAETIPGPTTETFARLARELGVVIVFNLFEREGDKTYDSSPVLDADGTLLGRRCTNGSHQSGSLFFLSRTTTHRVIGARWSSRRRRAESGSPFATTGIIRSTCPARRHFLTDRRPEVYPL